MVKEVWRPVVGYEGYEVSSLGRIRSLNYKRGIGKIKLMAPQAKASGYLFIGLRKPKCKKKMLYIHRLVAFAFPEICGKWFEGCQVNHKNMRRDDNRAVNLEVCTAIENLAYSDIFEKPVLQLTRELVLVRKHSSRSRAAKETGISRANIFSCLKGKSKTAGGYIWRYA